MTTDAQRKRLFDMEIDEISLVDKGANQHAAIVFSKAFDHEEGSMPDIELYDVDGDPVETLEHGDLVYDEYGNEYVWTEDDDDSNFTYEPQYAEIGKGFSPTGAVKELKTGFRHGRNIKGWAKGGMTGEFPEGAAEFGANAGRFGRAGAHLGAHAEKYAAGTAAGAAAGGGGLYAHHRMKKSLGDVVMEELSKADTEEQRSEIIAKAMHEVEIAKSQAEEAWDRVAAQDDYMLRNEFISKAAEYNLPMDPEYLGDILKSASTVLSYEQLENLDQLFNGLGETLYEEVGYVGDTDNNSVLDVVNGYVGELIDKADATPEMLSTAIFEQNPEAYDAYLEENNWR